MDNNAAEQSIRPFCVGKKNWAAVTVAKPVRKPRQI
mgnify:CR=1 FL=1